MLNVFLSAASLQLARAALTGIVPSSQKSEVSQKGTSAAVIVQIIQKFFLSPLGTLTLALRKILEVYITISTFTSVRLSGVIRPSSRHTFRFPIPAVVSQNVSNNSCLACVQSEKYSFWFTLRSLGSIR